MKIVSFIEEEAVVKKNLCHSDLWTDSKPHPPPKPPPNQLIPPATIERSILDFDFTSTKLSAGFEWNCA